MLCTFIAYRGFKSLPLLQTHQNRRKYGGFVLSYTIFKGVDIANENTKNSGVYLLPTNTEECYIVIPVGVKYPETTINMCPRWNPKAEDILSEDWELSA